VAPSVSDRSRFSDSKSGRSRSGWSLGRWFASKPDPLIETLFERASDGYLVCSAEGKVLSCNPAAQQLIGDDVDAIEGRHVARLFEHSSERRFSLKAGPARLLARDGGASRPVTLHLTEYMSQGTSHVLVRLLDASERHEVQEQLRQLANYDSLTGLPNRMLFRDRLGQAMARAKRHGQAMALMFLDLDRFKVVNDDLGHEAGDLLLQHVAKTLSACLRAGDSVSRDESQLHTLSRLGGDEFTLIIENVGSPEDAAHVARRMLEALAVPFVLGEEELVVTASIGISIYPTDDVDLDTLIRHTDMAMYRSKSLGRATYSFFSEDLSAAVTARVSLEGHLRRAVEREEFVLHFQPKADLRSGKITGVEALVRWHRPGHGLVPPDRFVGVLEDTGLILPVGAWVIRAACQQLAAWDRLGLPPLGLAVNLSARQFRHLYLASMIEDSLRENAIDPQRLEIELTESLLMEDNEATRAMLDSFRRLGVRLAIDDFGTGHSSLSYIQRFAIDTLKIDRSFVQSLPDNSEDTAICSAVIALGRNMKMCVVAEGVETPEQAHVLRELGCDEVQGYWISRAMPAADFAPWYMNYSRTRVVRKRSRRAYSDTSPITLFSLLD
jgi:diguanylate cyclase (GGDEF)-like protein/PAS domain S-box-containing protein